jgi:hypothetical protein
MLEGHDLCFVQTRTKFVFVAIGSKDSESAVGIAKKPKARDNCGNV